MAWEFIDDEPQPQLQKKEPTGFLGNIGQGALETLAAVAGIPGTIQQYTGINPLHPGLPIQSPTSEQLTGLARQITGYEAPEKGSGTSFGYNIGAGLPGAAAALATGGLSAAPMILGSTLGGASGSTIGEKIFGPIGGLIGGLAGSFGTNKGINAVMRKFGINPGDLLGSAQRAQELAYDTEKELGKNISGSSKRWDTNLEKYQDKIRQHSGIAREAKKELIAKAQESRQIAQGNKINGLNVAEKKREIGELYRLPMFKDPKNKKHLDNLIGVIMSEGDELGKTNAAWRTAWQEGDDITKILKYGENLQNLAQENPGLVPQLKAIMSNKLVKAIGYGSGLAGGAYAGLFPLAAAGVGGIEGIRQGINHGKYFGQFLKYPSTTKLLQDAAKQTANRQMPQLLRTYSQLNANAEKYSKAHPEVLEEVADFAGNEQGQSGWEFVD